MLRKIREQKQLSDELRNEAHQALREAKERFLAQRKAAAA